MTAAISGLAKRSIDFHALENPAPDFSGYWRIDNGITIGFITPPYGIALYVAAAVAERGILQVAKKVWQPLVVTIGVLILISYVPSLALWLPKKLMG